MIKPEKEKYLRRAKELLHKPVKKKAHVGTELLLSHPSSHSSNAWEKFGGPLTLERSNSDPISKPLVQRVVPTMRADVNDLPHTKATAQLRAVSPNDASESERGNLTPSPESMYFPSSYPSENAHRLSSTPLPRTREQPYDSSSNPLAEQELAALTSKCTELESRLKLQTNVNKELKRLLVASMGSDLQHRLNQIAEEKATITQDLDTSLQQLADNHEEIDRVSIECDIWRSKFLASRLMIDELAGWKAEVSRQLRECQRALKFMLKEHTELGKAVIQCNHHLDRFRLKLKTQPDGRGFWNHSDDNVLEVAKAMVGKAQVLCEKFTPVMTEKELSFGGIEKATPGEHLAKKVLKSSHQPYTTCISERNLSTPIRFNEEKGQQPKHSPTLSQQTLQQYFLNRRTQNILFSCNRCQGRIYNV